MFQKSSFLLFFLLFSSFIYAQTPAVGVIADVNEFPSTSFCSTATLTNSGAPGFGPYVQVIVPVGLTLDSSNLFGSNVGVTNVGVFPAAPGNQLIDPITGLTVTGAEGSTFYVVQPPIGSVVAGGVALELDLCFTIDPTAPVNVPINVVVTPVYEFGDTPTGDNGPIVGSAENFDVTPILVEFEKSNSAPEGERPPGPDWPVTYTLTADVAPNNTIDNLVIADTLPVDFIIDVPSINIVGGVNCVVNTSSPLNITCDSVTGTGGDDVVVTYSGYYSDVLNEAVCESRTETNTATFDGEFPLATAIPQITDTSVVELEHLSIQKSVSSDSASPGETLTFTLNIQISEYATSDSLVLVDSLPDGYTFVGNETSSLGAITAAVANDTPGVGQTELTFDLTALVGNIVGGAPNIIVTYDASIDQVYENPAGPVLASDSLLNSVTANYSLTDGAICSDNSAANVDILPVVISKSVVNPQPSYKPGDDVTYRLTLQVPSGDTNGVFFQDFLPLPVFHATDISTTFGVDVVASPLDTLGLIPTSITTDAGTNSITINWPNITNSTPQTLSVDLTVTVVDAPFADDLNLSNLLQVTTENTSVITSTAVAPVLILVRAPELVITKGVLSADQGVINPSPATLPVNGNVTGVDANDSITFQITVANIGGSEAYNVFITDPAIPSLTACTLDSVNDGSGTGLAFTGDLVAGISLTNPLAVSDTALVNVTCEIVDDAIFNSTHVNLAFVSYASIDGGETFPVEFDAAQFIIASPTVDKTILQVLPNVDGIDASVTIGETIQYQVVVTLPEGQGNNAQIVDLLDNGLVFESFDSLTASPNLVSSVGFPTALANATAIGTRNGLFNFGTVNNTNTDNASAGSITVVYTVLVTDTAGNTAGGQRNNRVDFNTDSSTVRDTAPNRQIREPLIQVNKVATPSTADAGDTISYTITVSNNGRATNLLSPAFDVVLVDLLADVDLTLVAGSVVASQGTVTTGNVLGDTTIDVDVGTLAINGSMTVTFNAIISTSVASGETVENTATVTGYNSLPGDGRIYPAVSNTEVVNIDPAVTMKTVLGATSTEQSDGINTRGDGSLVDLTIGEEVTFEITTTLAEGVSPTVIITDNLPNNAAGQMTYVSASIISVGTNLIPTVVAPAPTVTLPSTVSFDFGSVTNTSVDDVVTPADQIVIQVTGRVTDIAANQGLEELINNVIVQFNTGLSATAQATIEVVEPRMTIDKTSTTSTADAGDTITFVMTVDNLLANNTSANAFDVTLTDNIPVGFTFSGNLTTVSGFAPDTLAQAAGVISATWDDYPIGSTTVISFDVTVDNTVTPNQIIQNTAGISWTSLPGGDPNERTNSDSDPHNITIGETGLLKVVTATSESSTGTVINGGEDDLTIGEQVTYRFTVTLPEGTTPNAVVFDQLPTGSSILSLVGSEIISLGANLTPTTGAVGDAGIASNTNADAYNDRATWTFGSILNTPDGLNNSDDQIVFEVVALVVDAVVNQGGANDVVNTANLTYTGGNLSGTALVDLVEPRLNITKATVPAVVLADAGDVIDFQISIEHIATSNADAFNLVLTDMLPNPGLSWIDDTAANFSSTCGAVVNSAGDPNITFTINQLTLATGTCTISYKAVVDLAVKPGISYTNDVDMQYDSTPVFVAGATRRTLDSSSASFDIGDVAMSKVVTSTSLGDTGNAIGNPVTEDLAIGELVDYTITITVPEGTTNDATLQDNLPVAVSGSAMEVVSAVVTSVGGNITTSLLGTPVLSDTDLDLINDQTLFDFGVIVNQPDGVVNADDQISVTITARIMDVTANVAVETLINDALFTYGFSGFTLSDSADVELVEPNLGLDKSMGAPVGLVVPIQFILNNTGGTASAYDLVLVDVFSDSIWDLSTITATNIPTGFDFTVTPGAGQSTVTISSATAGTPPATSIEPNEVLVFEFTVEIRDDISLPTSIDNTVTLTEASSMPGVNGGERDYSDIIAMDTLQLAVLDATKTDALVIDNGTIGQANPDDTLRYTIVIENTGAAATTSTVFSDAPDANTTLVVGTVTTTQGVITVGNSVGDGAVVVDIGTLAAASSVTITFDVIINNPFPIGITEVSNQGLIETGEFPPIDTNDPDTVPDDDPTITPIGAGHDLEISKDDGGITAMAGDTVVYTINYANTGDQNSTGVVITETVPNTTTFNSASSTAGWSCVNGDPAGTPCSFTVGNLNGGDSGMVLFAIDVFDPKPSGVTEILNNVSIADDGNNGPEDDTTNNNDSDTTPIDAVPDMSITKTDVSNVVAPGGVIVYNLVYQNVGSQNATGVVITETVPTNTTFDAASSSAGWTCPDNSIAGTTCNLSIGAVTAGATAVTVNFAVEVNNPLATGIDTISNSVSIADDGNNGVDPNPNNNVDDEDTSVDAVPDLIISKDDGGMTAVAGSTIPYLITYSNIGDQEATGVVITETVPANTAFNAGASGAWTCVPNINAGSSCTINVGSVLGGGGTGVVIFAVDVVAPKPSGVTLITNNVSIADDGNNGVEDPTNNTGSDNTPVEAAPDLVISKVAQASVINAAGLLIYDLSYENVGTQDATGVVISEAVPVETAFNAASSTAGWSCADAAPAGTLCTFAVGAVGAGAGLQTIQFAVTVEDPLSAGTDEIVNTASIGDDGTNGPDPTPGDNTSTEITPVDDAPDLVVLKSDVVNLVGPGEVIVYNIEYQNIGNQNATGVVITETVPLYTTFNSANSTVGWSCVDGAIAGSTCNFNVGNVNAGDALQMIQFAANVLDPIPAGIDDVDNTVVIADDGNNGPDANPINNTAIENTLLGALPDLSIIKSDGGVTAGPGQVVVYTLDYSNIGNQNATGVIITETVPDYSTFIAASSSAGWVCLPDNNAGSSCSYTVGNLDAGVSGQLTFAVTVEDPLPAGVNELINTAGITDDGTNGVDPDPNNNTTVETTGLLLEPPVGIKVGEFDANNNRLIHWTFYWFNPNNNRDLPVFIYDPMPSNVTFAGGESCVATGASSCTTPVFNASLNRLELNAVLAPDSGAAINSTMDMLANEVVIKFDTYVTNSGSTLIVNQAEANWDEDNDGNPNNDADNGQIPVLTDFPLTPEVGDPTILATIYPVPTLNIKALLLLIGLFLLVMYGRNRLYSVNLRQ